MSEEIIINGIDVSECYADNKMMKDGLYCFWEGGNCADNEFCYFKQLKRLQEENKSLQMLSCANCGEKYLSPDGSELYEKNVQLKQALEEIKEIAEVSSLNTYWTILNNCENCHDNNECGEQSPIAKLKFIKDKIDEVLNESITNNNAD